MRRLSQKTGIHSTTLSQIVKGSRPLSLEQAMSIAEELGLNPLQSKFFLTLLQRERAGTEALRKFFDSELKLQKAESRQLVHVMKKDKRLSEEEKARFYSNWYYSCLPVLSSLPGMQSARALMLRTGLSRSRFQEALGFLLKAGIMKETKGKLEPGVMATHLDAQSSYISRHHGNWRVKAMDRHPNLTPEELAYSSPMSLSKEDAKKVRALLLEAVKRTGEIMGPSDCEVAYCLNVDWFEI